jgi:hypothetical protein
MLIVNGGGRASQVVDLVNFDVERKGNVMAHHLEAMMIEQLLDIAPRACEEIIDAYNVCIGGY